MEKIAALWNLFRKGEACANPAAWKTGQVSATALGAAIVAAVHVLSTFGVSLPIDEGSALALAGGIIAAVNIVLTYTTTDKIGILPAKGQPVPADAGTPVQTISEADVRAGIDFANKAAGQSPAGRGQNIE